MIEKLFEETIPYSNLFYLYTIFSLTYPTSSLSYPWCAQIVYGDINASPLL